MGIPYNSPNPLQKKEEKGHSSSQGKNIVSGKFNACWFLLELGGAVFVRAWKATLQLFIWRRLCLCGTLCVLSPHVLRSNVIMIRLTVFCGGRKEPQSWSSSVLLPCITDLGLGFYFSLKIIAWVLVNDFHMMYMKQRVAEGVVWGACRGCWVSGPDGEPVAAPSCCRDAPSPQV